MLCPLIDSTHLAHYPIEQIKKTLPKQTTTKPTHKQTRRETNPPKKKIPQQKPAA